MSGLLRRRSLIYGAGAVTSLVFHDDAYSSTDQITVPGTIQAGDLIVLSDIGLNKGPPPSLVTPAGFTNWINITATIIRVAVSYKIATGSENVLTGMNASAIDDKILAVFRGNAPITSVTASTPTTQVTNVNPAAQNINADGGGTLPLIAFGFYVNGDAVAVSPRTMSPAATAELNGGAVNYHYVKYQLQNAALADVSVDMDDEGDDNMLAGGFLWAA